MHSSILNKEQLELLPLVRAFNREFYLVGGTAIALHIRHRRSIDFDLFKKTPLNQKKILNKIASFQYPYKVTRNVAEQLDVIVKEVKFTFYEYPFDIVANCNFTNIIKFPELGNLAAMKAYTLGRRSKWKDYVDLYFIIKYHFTIKEISDKATTIFGDLFSEKLFRAQLCYFKDIDYTEQVEYHVLPVNEDEIKAFLTDIATGFV